MGGVWHYEYAVFNMKLDRAIQSFSVPVGPGVNISKMPVSRAASNSPASRMMARWGDAGYSSTPWCYVDNITDLKFFITWSTETFATNQNANAIRWGTLYNFRFDADQVLNFTNATVGFFKTGFSPAGVVVQAPGGVPSPTPSPTPTATPPVTPVLLTQPQRPYVTQLLPNCDS